MADTVQNGKGSKPRPYSAEKYAENFDAIDWSKGRKSVEPPIHPTWEEILSSDYRSRTGSIHENVAEILKEMGFSPEAVEKIVREKQEKEGPSNEQKV